ncbi:MAG: RNA-binding S4 domain-containing protein [Pseudomonadota bacterium]|nr:RNA-binding S4 domain-containing protein [Pseudomonadota bacterium]
MPNDDKADNYRLDKWLWHVRFYKTRSLATAAINGGKVHLNAERIKPAHRVRIGDRLSVSQQGMVAEYEVLGLPMRRGSAAEAHTHCLETAASAERGVKLREQLRLAQLSRPRSEGRPDKRDRRRLLRLQRQ